MDSEELEIFANDESTSCECLQVVPIGDQRAAMLFLLADPDYVTTVSAIFVADGFDPDKVRQTLLTSEWLMSLSASPSDELFALEATTNMWRFWGETWTRDKIGDHDMRRVWAKSSEGAIVVGADGMAYRLVGGAWQPIPPISDTQYFDIHGRPGSPLHACGSEGALHRLDPAGWQAIEIFRSDQFRGIDVATDSTIRLAGDGGVCLRLRGDEAVELTGTDLTCFCVRSFRNETYWGDEGGLYVEKGEEIIPFLDTDIASDLRSDGEFLYVAGLDTAWRFDGETWKSLTLVYDGGLRLV